LLPAVRFFSQAVPPHRTQKRGLSQLNSLGKDGWVLVGFTFSPKSQTGLNDEYHYVFKRPQK